MHNRLIGVLDRVEATVAEARDVVPDGSLDPTARAAERIRNRLDYPLDLALVALAGGTGSGKSSLFNAILESERAEVGGLRPTTSRAMVSLPAGRSVEIAGYVSTLGDIDVVTHKDRRWLALLDLPDTDSVEGEHRLMVSNLLPLVDAVVWVVDVEKYRDNTLHQGFLRPLNGYESQFVFVLNQIDRVTGAELEGLVGDFTESLREDGYNEPTVRSVAANPPLSSPKGIPELVETLEANADGFAISRMLTDLEIAVGDLQTILGDTSLDFDVDWQSVLDEALDLVGENDVVGGSRALSGFLLRVADNLSGEASEVSMSLAAHIGEILSEANRQVQVEIPARIEKSAGWGMKRDPGVDLASPERRILLRARIGDTVEVLRPFLRRRAVARANLVGLAIDLAELRSSYGD
jgi:50S ribosome-binding GTPase